jgi:hypothetical protein
MEANEKWKTYSIGAGFGAMIAVFAGFGLGGWMTGGRANDKRFEFARAEVTAALVPYCVERARNDPQFIKTLAQIKKAGSFNRTKIVLQAGWATMSVSSKPDHVVANACMEALVARN